MNIYRRLINLKNKIYKNILPEYFYKTAFLSQLYYLFFDDSFKREMKAVLHGKAKHIRESKVVKANYYLLVRNIHRIEKGLLMKPRRDVFAKSFIKETLDSFEGVWVRTEDNPQMKWFYDVLNEYFSVSGEDTLINECRTRFNDHTRKYPMAVRSQEGCASYSVPYYREESENTNIDFTDFFKLTKLRRSVRWFLPDTVDRQLIDKAILAANMSPSACNRQPFEFKIFDDPELVKEVIDFPMGTKGYGHSVPVLVVIVGNLDAYFDERDRHIIYVDASLASMTFMLALETLGLSSCPINWPDIEKRERKMDEFLGLKPFQRTIMCLGIGYADPKGLIAFSEKRSLEMIRNYNNSRNGN